MPSNKMNVALIGAAALIVAACITAAATLASRDPAPSTEPHPEPSVTQTYASTPSSEDRDSPDPDETSDASPAPAVQAETWLADLEPIVDKGLWMSGVATIRGESYLHALQSSQTGVQGQTVWAQYAPAGEYSRLTGLLGIADGGHSSETAWFEIVVDGVVVHQAELAIGSQPSAVDVPLAGAQDLILRVTNTSQSAYWANPVFADFLMQ